MKLELELIPEGSWYSSLAHLLPKEVWDTLRREVYSLSNYTCIICGATNTRVNCHETWKWNDKTRVQKLMGFRCLCDDCHLIKHWGRTVRLVHEGKLPSDTIERLTKHFCTVNNCTLEDFQLHKVKSGDLYQKRSRHKYRIDFGKFEPEEVVKTWKKLKKS